MARLKYFTTHKNKWLIWVMWYVSNTLWVIKWHQSSKPILDPEFIAARQMGLERFLHRLVAQPKLASDKLVLEFLTEESGWDEKVEATDYVKKSGKKSFCQRLWFFGDWNRRLSDVTGGCVLIFKKPLGWSKSRPNLKLIIRKLLKWNIILKESGYSHIGLMWLWWSGHFVATVPILCQSVFERIIWTSKSHFENASENKRKSI